MFKNHLLSAIGTSYAISFILKIFDQCMRFELIPPTDKGQRASPLH